MSGVSSVTPRIDVDLTRAVEALDGLRDTCPDAVVHYRVGANDSSRLLAAFAEAGCAFDVRSVEELQAVVRRGVPGERILSSHPVSTRADLAEASRAGVRGFVADSPAEVAKLAEVAPGSGVLVRLLASGSRCPSGRRKYGCPVDLAPDLLLRAASAGLRPWGVSVPAGWAATADAIRAVDGVRSGADGLGIDLAVVHVDDVRAGVALPGRGLAGSSRLWLSAGHALAAPGGVLVASVVAVVERAGRRWIHLDGIAATESVEIRTARSGPTVSSVLAGPADTGEDVLFAAHAVALPAALREGDHVRFTHAGPRPWARPAEEPVSV